MNQISIVDWGKEISELPQVLKEKIAETLDEIGDARGRILSSFEHAQRTPEIYPWAEAVAEDVYETELKPLTRRFRRLVSEYKLLNNEAPVCRINAQDVKNRTDLREIVERYGVRLRKAGKLYVGRCPFGHEDKHPSFVLYPDQQFHCFSCQKHGDVFTFIELIENCEFKQALKILV